MHHLYCSSKLRRVGLNLCCHDLVTMVNCHHTHRHTHTHTHTHTHLHANLMSPPEPPPTLICVAITEGVSPLQDSPVISGFPKHKTLSHSNFKCTRSHHASTGPTGSPHVSCTDSLQTPTLTMRASVCGTHHSHFTAYVARGHAPDVITFKVMQNESNFPLSFGGAKFTQLAL